MEINTQVPVIKQGFNTDPTERYACITLSR